jgi:hypothetical protein
MTSGEVMEPASHRTQIEMMTGHQPSTKNTTVHTVSFSVLSGKGATNTWQIEAE